jgi:hypothetical protein
LELPGGWSGFSLEADARNDGCGYDYLCAYESKKIKMEVKTFAPQGRVHLTARELQEAATSREEYFLVGVLDTGGPPDKWPARVLRDPLHTLLSRGEFEIEATLALAAHEVFGSESEHS